MNILPSLCNILQLNTLSVLRILNNIQWSLMNIQHHIHILSSCRSVEYFHSILLFIYDYRLLLSISDTNSMELCCLILYNLWYDFCFFMILLNVINGFWGLWQLVLLHQFGWCLLHPLIESIINWLLLISPLNWWSLHWYWSGVVQRSSSIQIHSKWL